MEARQIPQAEVPPGQQKEAEATVAVFAERAGVEAMTAKSGRGTAVPLANGCNGRPPHMLDNQTLKLQHEDHVIPAI